MRSFIVSRTVILGAAFAAATTAAACSAGHPDVSSSAQNIVINPGGTENESDVTIQLPTDACVPGASCAKVLGATPSLYVDGVAVSLGGTTRIKPGSHNVAVNGIGWPLTTTAGEHTTVTLPVADTVCTDATLPNVPVTNFGGAFSVANAPCPTVATGSAVGVPSGSSVLYYYAACNASYVVGNPASSYNCAGAYAGYNYYYENAAGTCVSGGAGVAGCTAAQQGAEVSSPGNTALTSAYEAYAPGTITATVNGSTQTLTLNPGDETTFNISLPATSTLPATFATTLTFLDPRANPDATAGTITSSCAGDRSYTIPAATGTPAPLALTAFVNSACTYTLTVGGRTQALTQTAANAISLHRLDVDNVTVTRQDLDGGTYTVVGTYTLNYGGVQVAGPYNTGTGIDVLPGTYEFSLTYTDFDGPQKQTQTLTF